MEHGRRTVVWAYTAPAAGAASSRRPANTGEKVASPGRDADRVLHAGILAQEAPRRHSGECRTVL